MYNNVGNKIKVLAKWVGIFLLVASVIAWLVLITNTYSDNSYYQTEDDFMGWVCLVVGALGFVSSWLIYGFGERVENVGAIRYYLSSQSRSNGEASAPKGAGSIFKDASSAKDFHSSSDHGTWTCTCGKANPSYTTSCSCGVNKRDIK